MLNDMKTLLFGDFIGGMKSTNSYCPRLAIVNYDSFKQLSGVF